MIPFKTIEDLIKKHLSLEKDLSKGKIDKKLFAEKSKEYSDLNEIIQDAKKYISYEKNKSELELSLISKALIPISIVFDGSSNQTAVGITPGDDVIFGISTKTEFISF